MNINPVPNPVRDQYQPNSIRDQYQSNHTRHEYQPNPVRDQCYSPLYEWDLTYPPKIILKITLIFKTSCPLSPGGCIVSALLTFSYVKEN